jgi:hypothetical protein
VHRSALTLVAFMVATSLLLGARVTTPARHIRVEPIVNFALPSTAAGCGGATALGGGAERIPITVSTVAGQVAELVNVCIGGSGPYPFVLDSGAGESIIDRHLATQLHLAHDGSSTEFEGVGCVGTAQPVGVTSWSVAGVPLAPQSLTAATLPDFGGTGQPVGLLGSDVLSRFGAVRLDFTAQTLTFGGPQGPAKQGNPPDVHGPTGPAPSAVLTQGEVGTTVPLTVVFTPGDISLNVRSRFGQQAAHTFVVDTGSSQSVVAKSLVKSAHLAATDLAQRQPTVCSTITAPLVHSGAWSIPGVHLHPQLLGSVDFGPISANGIAGLIGSDQLQHFGWVIFDYSGGRLVLG